MPGETFHVHHRTDPVLDRRGSRLRPLSRDRRLLLSARDPALSSVIASSHRNQTRSLLGGIAMETHALGQVHWHPRRANVATPTILRVGALAGITAGLMYAAWQMVVAAIAQNPTAVHGIHQTLWTPPEGIWSVAFGVHHFHGSFHFIPAFGGIVGHMGNSLIVGIMGVALLSAILGCRPTPAAAGVIGAAYGIAVEAILINWIVNTQKVQTLYSSTPHWSWWVGHAIFGVTLGLLSSVLLRRNNLQQREASLSAS